MAKRRALSRRHRRLRVRLAAEVTVSQRTVEELRTVIRTGDELARVEAAWDLAMRLGSEATVDLRLEGEPSSGVRRHWLTVLAGFGEVDAVRAIAAQHDGDSEGEHATLLALRVGQVDGDWLAERFIGGTSHLRRTLMDEYEVEVDWKQCSQSLRDMLEDDFEEARVNALRVLTGLVGPGDEGLRLHALRRPSEASPFLQEWARGDGHRDLLLALADEPKETVVGSITALRDATRTYPLDDIRELMLAHGEAVELWDGEGGRRLAVLEVDSLLQRGDDLRYAWLALLGRVAMEEPWEGEQEVVERWRRAANAWEYDEDEDWWESPHTAALRALGCEWDLDSPAR